MITFSSFRHKIIGVKERSAKTGALSLVILLEVLFIARKWPLNPPQRRPLGGRVLVLAAALNSFLSDRRELLLFSRDEPFPSPSESKLRVGTTYG